jgi:hypothetical protein
LVRVGQTPKKVKGLGEQMLGLIPGTAQSGD